MGHRLLPHLIPLWYLSAPFPFYVLWIPPVVHGVSYAEQKHKVTTQLQRATTHQQACLIRAVRARRQRVHPFPTPRKLLQHKKLSPPDCSLLGGHKQLSAPVGPEQFSAHRCDETCADELLAIFIWASPVPTPSPCHPHITPHRAPAGASAQHPKLLHFCTCMCMVRSALLYKNHRSSSGDAVCQPLFLCHESPTRKTQTGVRIH